MPKSPDNLARKNLAPSAPGVEGEGAQPASERRAARRGEAANENREDAKRRLEEAQEKGRARRAAMSERAQRDVREAAAKIRAAHRGLESEKKADVGVTAREISRYFLNADALKNYARDLAKVAETALDTNEVALPDGQAFPVEWTMDDIRSLVGRLDIEIALKKEEKVKADKRAKAIAGYDAYAKDYQERKADRKKMMDDVMAAGAEWAAETPKVSEDVWEEVADEDLSVESKRGRTRAQAMAEATPEVRARMQAQDARVAAEMRAKRHARGMDEIDRGWDDLPSPAASRPEARAKAASEAQKGPELAVDVAGGIKAVSEYFLNADALKRYVDDLASKEKGAMFARALQMPDGQPFPQEWMLSDVRKLIAGLREEVARRRKEASDVKRGEGAAEDVKAFAEARRLVDNLEGEVSSIKPSDDEGIERLLREARRLSAAYHPDRHPTFAESFTKLQVRINAVVDRLRGMLEFAKPREVDDADVKYETRRGRTRAEAKAQASPEERARMDAQDARVADVMRERAAAKGRDAARAANEALRSRLTDLEGRQAALEADLQDAERMRGAMGRIGAWARKFAGLEESNPQIAELRKKLDALNGEIGVVQRMMKANRDKAGGGPVDLSDIQYSAAEQAKMAAHDVMDTIGVAPGSWSKRSVDRMRADRGGIETSGLGSEYGGRSRVGMSAEDAEEAFGVPEAPGAHEDHVEFSEDAAKVLGKEAVEGLMKDLDHAAEILEARAEGGEKGMQDAVEELGRMDFSPNRYAKLTADLYEAVRKAGPGRMGSDGEVQRLKNRILKMNELLAKGGALNGNPAERFFRS